MSSAAWRHERRRIKCKRFLKTRFKTRFKTRLNQFLNLGRVNGLRSGGAAQPTRRATARRALPAVAWTPAALRVKQANSNHMNKNEQKQTFNDI